MAKEEVRGIEELERNLQIFKDTFISVVRDGVFHGCTLIANDAKADHGPDAHSKGRYIDRTSNLTNSIQPVPPEVKHYGIQGEVIAGEEYAAAVELGAEHTPKGGETWKSKPYPFLFPALEKYSVPIYEFLIGAIQKIVWINRSV